MNILLLLPIVIPIILGLVLPFLKLEKTIRNVYVFSVLAITSVISIFIMFNTNGLSLNVVNINTVFNVGFKVDGLTKVFGTLLAILWPMTSIYAFDYMKKEGNEVSFFRYFIIAFGIANGIAYSKSFISMYLFYELLTFTTLPLIMHHSDKKEVLYAGKVYLIVSILGATTALMGIIILSTFTNDLEFVYGGHKLMVATNDVYKIGYLLCFIGFAVKAAIVPFTYWLPVAGIAPTPVTALLHAVAVVKAGVFAVMRTTYYAYDISVLANTYAQYVPILLAGATIIYASFMAVREQHLKRRLAYSTASNLSYILVVVALMTPTGFAAGMIHMVFHAIIKITLFFIVGAILIYYKKEFVKDIKGYGLTMKTSFVCFTIASLGLIGMPLTCGFISKYNIVNACIEWISNNKIIGSFAIVAVVVSAILTIVYLFTIIVSAYFVDKNYDLDKIKNIKDPSLYMMIPIVILTISIIAFGLYSNVIVDALYNVARGLI